MLPPHRGPLPNVPGMFNELRVFNITRNLMTGSIADSWGNAGIFKLVRQKSCCAIDRLWC